jgi:uncharacterized phage protein gp47/JayE
MTNFNYAARDYDTIKTDLLARAERILPEWTDRDPSDFGMLLVDLWAYMGDVQHYYIDRAASEAFLDTATQRESVLALANLFDYKPLSVSSANGTVTVANSNTETYTVEKDTEFTARHNDKTFVVHARDSIVIPASGSDTVPVREGVVVEDELLTDSASGLPGQFYTLASAGAAPATIRIEVYEDGVNATEYEYVGRLSLAAAGARVFTTQTGPDNFVEVLFGSTTNGYVPPSGSTITATYANCSGLEGNLPANVVTGFVNAVTTGISVSSSTVFSGGADAESIASMKQSIPAVISIQDRAVTEEDFVAVALTVPGVSKAALEYTAPAAGTVQTTSNRGIASGVATLEITSHGYVTGDVVRVDNVGVDYDGVHVIQSAPTADTFTYNTNGADETYPVVDTDGAVFQIGEAEAKLYLQESRTDYLTTVDNIQTVDTALRTTVEETVQDKALLGVSVTTAATITWEPIDVTYTVYVNSRAVTNTVTAAVEAALDNLFSFDNVSFGQLMHLGQVHRTILNVPGVDYVTVEKFDVAAGGPTSVQNTIQVQDYRLPKKGTYAATYVGGISTS